MADRLVRVVRSVQAGVNWLRDSSNTARDARSLAATVSALVAAERNPHSILIQRLVREAIGCQNAGGSWNDELWDTTWVVRALIDAKHPAESLAIQRALRFLRATQDPVDGTWYEEPFETMLVLDLLLDLQPDDTLQFARPAFDWLASLQRSDGLIVGTRYTGMAVSLFLRLEADDPRRIQVVGRGTDYLRAVLKARGIWTGAAWSNFYGLNALIDAGSDIDDPALASAVDWFLDAQETSGRWKQVSQIHDTAMAVRILARLLSAPLVDVSIPAVAVLNASRENGTLRVGFMAPGLGAIAPLERMKLSEVVRSELSTHQRQALAAIGRTGARGYAAAPPPDAAMSGEEVLVRSGQYTYGHLVPPRIQAMLEDSTADHLRLDVDERLIDLPWELVHDGQDFLCTRYAVGRRILSDQPLAARTQKARHASEGSALVIANPTGDLPAAEMEGERVSELLERRGVQVTFWKGRHARKRDILMALRDHDIVHFAGHAKHEPSSPDESFLLACDGEVQAFEIARFLKDSKTSVVFLNACWSAEEEVDVDAYSPMMRGLGRTFMFAGVTAFVGYLVPVPDSSATRFALEFYTGLIAGRTIGESLRLSRIALRARQDDLTWASAVLYGEPAAHVFALQSSTAGELLPLSKA